MYLDLYSDMLIKYYYLNTFSNPLYCVEEDALLLKCCQTIGNKQINLLWNQQDTDNDVVVCGENGSFTFLHFSYQCITGYLSNQREHLHW